MAGPRHLVGTADVNLIEAPVTWRAYVLCGFASFGGSIHRYLKGACNLQRLTFKLPRRYPERL